MNSPKTKQALDLQTLRMEYEAKLTYSNDVSEQRVLRGIIKSIEYQLMRLRIVL